MSLQHLPLAAAATATAAPAAAPSKPRNRTWDENYAELLKFHAQHGHAQVPMRYKADPILGKWCSHNREYYVAGQLAQERIDSMEAIGFVWSPHEKKWNDNFSKLVAFRSQFGHTKIKCHHAADPALGKWVARQREDFQMGRMNPQRQEKLAAIGFTFRITKGHKNKGGNARTEAQWQRMYEKLLDFRAENGHVNVPRKDKEVNPLEKWVGAQRLKYQRGQLSKERVQKLEAVGFIWKFQAKKSQEEWNKMYGFLKQCQKDDGTFAPALLGNAADASSLSRWIQRQKEKYRNYKLEVGRELLLRRLNFNFPDRPQPPPKKNDQGDGDEEINAAIGEIVNNNNGDAKQPAKKQSAAIVGQSVAESIEVLAKFMCITPSQLAAKLELPMLPPNPPVAAAAAAAAAAPPPQQQAPPQGGIAFRRLMPLIIRLRDSTDEETLSDCFAFLQNVVSAQSSDSADFLRNVVQGQSAPARAAAEGEYFNALLELAVDLDRNGGCDEGVVEVCEVYFQQYLPDEEEDDENEEDDDNVAQAPRKRSAVDPTEGGPLKAPKFTMVL